MENLTYKLNSNTVYGMVNEVAKEISGGNLRKIALIGLQSKGPDDALEIEINAGFYGLLRPLTRVEIFTKEHGELIPGFPPEVIFETLRRFGGTSYVHLSAREKKVPYPENEEYGFGSHEILFPFLRHHEYQFPSSKSDLQKFGEFLSFLGVSYKMYDNIFMGKTFQLGNVVSYERQSGAYRWLIEHGFDVTLWSSNDNMRNPFSQKSRVNFLETTLDLEGLIQKYKTLSIELSQYISGVSEEAVLEAQRYFETKLGINFSNREFEIISHAMKKPKGKGVIVIEDVQN